MRLFSGCRVVWVLALFLLSAVPVWAQTAQLSGTIKDRTGAMVPNATITLTNQDTGIKREVTSNADGLYSIPFLPPGKYKLNVQSPGFQTVTQTGIVLNMGGPRSLQLALKLQF